MELKPYQHKVIKDLENYLGYVQKHKRTDDAFNQYWEDKIGPYNPVSGSGMVPYKNNIPNCAHVCVKVPTAGGKTFIAVNALHTIFSAFDSLHPKAVVWLVPWSNLLQQTVKNLNNPDHPYRQKLNSLFNHRVKVYEKGDLLQGSDFNPTVVNEQLTIIVMSFSSLRARKKEDRKVYQENGQLESFVGQYKDNSHLLEDVDDTALINVIRSLNPVLVVDESHNAESDLSVDMLSNLNPSFILDLTATPKENSNIVSLVPAIELKKENMVKLPVIVYNSHDKTEVVNNALHLQHKLEKLAKEEEKQGGKYIRPIVLFQAQPKTKDDNTTFEKLKNQLLKVGIPNDQIKIKTANIDELKGIDLMSKDCEVRYIITINALKEGWDCPFAYILASLADKSSAVDVEQILGRVLRQPYVKRHDEFQLNLSYVLTASSKFNDTLQNIVKGLQSSGFSEKDYRSKNVMTEEVSETSTSPVEQFLFPEKQEEQEDEIDTTRVSFTQSEDDEQSNTVITRIEDMANEQSQEMAKVIEEQERQSADDNIFEELPDTMVNRYKLKESYKEQAQKLNLPQFFIKIKGGDIFGTTEELLNRESLLKGFKLSKADINISFEDTADNLYKVDIEKENAYRPSYIKIEESVIKEPLAEYILAQPEESQKKSIMHQILTSIGKMNPIPEQEIKAYVQRILEPLNADQLREALAKKYTYANKIKRKINALADEYAEQQFNDQLKVNKVMVQENWKFPSVIVPGTVGASIGNSLYEREGKMNDFEQTAIMELGSMPNIAFWHRNLERGKGFSINGFKSKHYADFILVTKNNNVILVETKGDHLDGTDSQAKCRLGNTWAEKAGDQFFYFMIFDSKPIEGAYKVSKAKELIKMID